MQFTVLLLEDNENINSRLKELLEKAHFEVFEAPKITDAIDIFKDEKIDFLIIDLNVPPIGLTKEERDKTLGGLLSGWIWFKNYVLKDYPEYGKKVIIYSAYVQQLKEKYPNEIKGIKIIDKGLEKPSKIIEELKKI